MPAAELSRAETHRRTGSCPPSTRRFHCHRTLYATQRDVQPPHYSFDPAALLAKSIQWHLEYLYRGSSFVANPTQQLSTALGQYRGRSTSCKQFGSRSRLRVSSAQCIPTAKQRESALFFSRRSTPCSKGSVPSLSSPQRPRPHGATAAAISLLSSTLPATSPLPAFCKQHHKERLIESELEPVPNLIGVRDYSLKGPHAVNRPRSAGGGEAEISTAELYRSGQFPTQMTPSLPHSRRSTTPSLLNSSTPLRSTIPLGESPSSVVGSSAQGFSRESTSSQRTHSRAPLADYIRVGNGTPLFPGEAAAGSHSGASPPSSCDSTSTFSRDSEDLFFDEDTLATTLLQGPAAARCPEATPKQESVQTERLHGKACDAGASGTGRAPTAEARVVGSRFSSDSQDELVRCAGDTISDLSTSFSTLSTNLASCADPGKPAPPAEPQQPSRSTLFLCNGSPTPRHHGNSIDDLLQKIQRLRVQYERSRHQGCSPSVCNHRFPETPLCARSGGTTAHAARFSSLSTFAATMHPHGRCGRSHQHRRRPNACPPSRDSVHRGHCSGCGHSVRHTRLAADSNNGDTGGSRYFFRNCSRCKCCKVSQQRDAVMPIPPIVPRDGALSAPRRGRLQPSSAASSAEPSLQCSPCMSDPFVEPQRIPSYGCPHHSEKAAHSHPLPSGSEEENLCPTDVIDEARARRRLDPYVNDPLLLITLLQGIIKDTRAGPKESENISEKDTAGRASSGATDEEVKALLRALLEEVRKKNAAYTELLRFVHGSDTSPASRPSATEAAHPTRRSVLSPYNSPHPPFTSTPPHATSRCDVAVEMMASPSFPSERSEENSYARRRRGDTVL
ncbi:hypothetical protein, unknown function [Leishmania tarentolae]|uniref:Uncharacterized protein n=1 Tax=Leishmania tarentolae TaxID=5689 RepID=A0A640KMH8_LEITA|nr:hypothetical protein, unknown function [Leishmania tarentolae]